MKRWDVLFDLINNKNPKVGAEIGCEIGTMTVNVLKKIPSIEKYYAVDSFEWYSDFGKCVNPKRGWSQDLMNENFMVFKNAIKKWKHKVEILKMFSNEACNSIPDNSLDFCFIDANHLYEYVKEDIKLYLPKMKKGGLFGGHDYTYKRGGVKKAVHEVFKKDVIINKNTWWVWIG